MEAEQNILSLVTQRAGGLDSGMQTLIMHMVDDGEASFMVDDVKITLVAIEKALVIFRNDEFLGVMMYANSKPFGFIYPPFDKQRDVSTTHAMLIAGQAYPYVFLTLEDAVQAGVGTFVDDQLMMYHDDVTCNRMWLLLNHAFPWLNGYMPERYANPDQNEINRRRMINEADKITQLLEEERRVNREKREAEQDSETGDAVAEGEVVDDREEFPRS